MTLRTEIPRGGDTPSRPAVDAAHPVPGFGATVASEWAKLWSVRSTYIQLAVMLVLTVGLSGVMSFFGSSGDLAAAQADGIYNVIFFGSTLGVWVFTYLGASFVATEFTGKVAEYSFVATPRRGRLLAAKMLIIAGVGLGSGLVISLANVVLTQSALASAGYRTLDLSDPGLWRSMLVFIALSMCVQGVLGGLVAVLVRNSFGALAIVALGINALPITLAQFLGEAYRTTVPRLMPGAAVESAAGLSPPTSDGYLPLGVALLVIALWLAVAAALAYRKLVRSDAR
jgi:ABC-2 type transport system permease protein